MKNNEISSTLASTPSTQVKLKGVFTMVDDTFVVDLKKLATQFASILVSKKRVSRIPTLVNEKGAPSDALVNFVFTLVTIASLPYGEDNLNGSALSTWKVPAWIEKLMWPTRIRVRPGDTSALNWRAKIEIAKSNLKCHLLSYSEFSDVIDMIHGALKASRTDSKSLADMRVETDYLSCDRRAVVDGHVMPSSEGYVYACPVKFVGFYRKAEFSEPVDEQTKEYLRVLISSITSLSADKEAK